MTDRKKKGHPEGWPKSREETPKKGMQRVRCTILLCCDAQKRKLIVAAAAWDQTFDGATAVAIDLRQRS